MELRGLEIGYYGGGHKKNEFTNGLNLVISKDYREKDFIYGSICNLSFIFKNDNSHVPLFNKEIHVESEIFTLRYLSKIEEDICIKFPSDSGYSGVLSIANGSNETISCSRFFNRPEIVLLDYTKDFIINGYNKIFAIDQQINLINTDVRKILRTSNVNDLDIFPVFSKLYDEDLIFRSPENMMFFEIRQKGDIEFSMDQDSFDLFCILSAINEHTQKGDIVALKDSVLEGGEHSMRQKIRFLRELKEWCVAKEIQMLIFSSNRLYLLEDSIKNIVRDLG